MIIMNGKEIIGITKAQSILISSKDCKSYGRILLTI